MMFAGKPFYGERIQTLGRLVATGDVVDGAGGVEAVDIAGDYVARLLADWDGGDRRLRVVWDNGNGAAGDVLGRLVAELPGEHTVLNERIDGHFPAHHPDPTVPKNLEQIIASVREQGADLGIAFDGDADRIGVVDGDGEILWGDQLLVVLARDVLRTRPGATIIADVKASQVLFDEIARAGGTPLMWRTGHSLIKTKMAETASPLAGEMSGHVFFADKWYGFDDALYAAVRLLGILARAPETLGQMRAGLPHTLTTPELRFDCADDRKFGRRRRGRGQAARRGRDGVRYRRRAGPHRGWLVAAARLEHAGRAGRAGGIEQRRRARASEGRDRGPARRIRPGRARFSRARTPAIERPAVERPVVERPIVERSARTKDAGDPSRMTPDPRLPRFQSMIEPGQWVRHPGQPDWGDGQVQSAIGERVTVNFAEGGKVVINARVVSLEILR